MMVRIRGNAYNRDGGLNKHGLREVGVLTFIHDSSTLLPQSAFGSGRNTRKEAKGNESFNANENYFLLTTKN